MKLHAAIVAAVISLFASMSMAADKVPETCSAGITVSAEEAMKIFQGNIAAMQAKALPSAMPVLIVDPRKPSDYEKGHIPGAVSLPIEEGQFTKDALTAAAGGNSAKPMMFYCNGENCPRSHMACEQAAKFGFTGKISYFYTGIGVNGWPRVNGPLVQGPKPYPTMP